MLSEVRCAALLVLLGGCDTVNVGGVDVFVSPTVDGQDGAPDAGPTCPNTVVVSEGSVPCGATMCAGGVWCATSLAGVAPDGGADAAVASGPVCIPTDWGAVSTSTGPMCCPIRTYCADTIGAFSTCTFDTTTRQAQCSAP